MDGIKISFGDILMAFTAGIHDLKFKGILICPFNGMRGMAIIASR